MGADVAPHLLPSSLHENLNALIYYLAMLSLSAAAHIICYPLQDLDLVFCIFHTFFMLVVCIIRPECMSAAIYFPCLSGSHMHFTCVLFLKAAPTPDKT